MNVVSVKLFLEVAEAGSLTKVAARRQIVQSHISRQISDFETECGGRLFRRTGRGVELTEFGERAVERLRLWLHDTEHVAQQLRADSGKLFGEVRVGIIPSAAHPLMTRAFEQLQTEHPGIHLNIAEAQGAQLDTMLDSGAVDFAILFRYPPSERKRREAAMRREHVPGRRSRRRDDQATDGGLLAVGGSAAGPASPAEPLAPRP